MIINSISAQPQAALLPAHAQNTQYAMQPAQPVSCQQYAPQQLHMTAVNTAVREPLIERPTAPALDEGAGGDPPRYDDCVKK